MITSMVLIRCYWTPGKGYKRRWEKASVEHLNDCWLAVIVLSRNNHVIAKKMATIQPADGLQLRMN